MDGEVCYEDTTGWKPGSPRVHSESRSNSIDVIHRINGSTRPSGSSPDSRVNCDAAHVVSPFKISEVRFAQLDSMVCDHPASLPNADRYGSVSDTHAQWKRSGDVDNASSSGEQHQINCLHDSERDNGPPPSYSAAKLRPQGVGFPENDHSGVNLNSFSVPCTDGNCESTPSGSGRPLDDAEWPKTPRNELEYSSPSPRKSAAHCDGVTVNGCSGPGPVADGLPTGCSKNDGDVGVVLDASDADVVCAVKPEKQPPSGFTDLDGDTLDRNAIRSPQNTSTIVRDASGDRETGNSDLPERAECRDERRHESMESGIGVSPFSCQSSGTCDAAVGESSSSVRRSSNGVPPAQIFSDISDDENAPTAAAADADPQYIDDHISDVENGRSLPERNEDRFVRQQHCGSVADRETENIFDDATQSTNNTEHDSCVEIVPEKTAAILDLTPTDQNGDGRSSQEGASEEDCRDLVVQSSDGKYEGVSQTQPDLEATACTEMDPGTELDGCDSARSVPVWDFGRLRRRGRRRPQQRRRTIHNVLEMLLKR